jgi:cephalosporin-C deacetylase
VTQDGNSLRAEGDGWWLRYTFTDDSIELQYDGQPAGAEHFRHGYPAAELVFSLASDLHRVCDPLEQGDLGWPLAGRFEPGNYAVMAPNGASLLFERAQEMHHEPAKSPAVNPPHRLDLVVLYQDRKHDEPVKRRLVALPKADQSRAVEMKIISPNPNHLFADSDTVVFPIEVTVHYGQALKGKVRFEGHNYVWKERTATAEIPVELTPDAPTGTFNLSIRPDQPGHYIGKVIVMDGDKPLYSKRVGFIFQPQKVTPVAPPKDFDQFWDQTLAELAKIPLDVTMTEQKEKETAAGKVYLVKYRSWENRWAWAWLYEPKAGAQVDAMVRCPPVSVWQPGRAQMADGSLRIDVAVHGGDISEYPAKSDFDYMNGDLADRDKAKLRYSYCCLARCFDIIAAHRLSNGTVHVQGSSQGAGLSLVLAGLRPAASVKGTAMALCRIDWTILGHTTWGPSVPAGADRLQLAESARYFDSACFAHRIHAPVTIITGLFDFCAPFEGVLTAVNALPPDAPFRMVIDPYGGHFTLNVAGRQGAEHAVAIPRWIGSDQDNKLSK